MLGLAVSKFGFATWWINEQPLLTYATRQGIPVNIDVSFAM
jgi:hypothetical protein